MSRNKVSKRIPLLKICNICKRTRKSQAVEPLTDEAYFLMQNYASMNKKTASIKSFKTFFLNFPVNQLKKSTFFLTLMR